MTTKIDSTINLLKGQLNSSAAKKGAEMIAKWEADLEKAEWRGAKTIHEDLIKLRHHLEGDKLDSAIIADLLVKMGESTERVATHAEGDDGSKLESLGHTLIKASEGVRGS